MKKFLIVIDCQHDFIDGSLGSEDAKTRVLPNVIEKIKKNRENGDYLILTRDTHDENYLNTFEGKHLPVEHCIKGTNGWQIHKDIMSISIPDEKPYLAFLVKTTFVDKPTFGSINAFPDYGFSDLQQAIECYLDGDELCLNDFEIELCGLCTDICVVSNALILRSIYPEVKITVDASACGGTSNEAHEAALTVMRSCQIEVV